MFRSIHSVSHPVNTLRIATHCIVRVMSDKAERLKDARTKAGFASAAEAAQRFGWQEPAYRHHENGTRGFGADSAKKYGRAFKVKPGWLLGIDGNSALPDAGDGPDELVVNGSVAAGVWRETEHWNDERQFVIRLPSPVPGARRFGLVVEGYSMDEEYQPGTVLDCISIYSGGVKPNSGDFVVVERTRSDGLRELTVKEYQEREGRFFLVPHSTKTEFKPIEYPGPDRHDERDPITGELIQVIAFVVADYPKRTLDLFRRMGVIEQH